MNLQAPRWLVGPLLIPAFALFTGCVLPERSPLAMNVSPENRTPSSNSAAVPAPTPAVAPAETTRTLAPPREVAKPAATATPATPAALAPSKVSEAEDAAPAKPGVTRYIPKDTFRGLDFGATIEKVSFGSCADQDLPQPIWKSVEKNDPDLFLFMGDIVYADRPAKQPIAEQYRKLDQILEYRSIRSKVPFMAIWDDGDLGTPDGGADAPTREVAKKDFLNYWNYAKNSLSMDQIKRGGMYHAKIIGPKNKVVQIIMLDTRYYRSPLKLNPAFTQENKQMFLPSTNRRDTLLGEDQWRFLEAQLRKPANLRLIVSSIQLIANDHGFEKWGNFPHERQRFFNLLKKTGAKNAVVLSGDRHIGTIAKTEIKGWGTLYDITSSSLNKAKDIQEKDASYTGNILSQENFGLATVNWNRRVLKVELRNKDNKTENSVEISLKK